VPANFQLSRMFRRRVDDLTVIRRGRRKRHDDEGRGIVGEETV